MAQSARVVPAGESPSRLGPLWIAVAKAPTLALGAFTGEMA